MASKITALLLPVLGRAYDDGYFDGLCDMHHQYKPHEKMWLPWGGQSESTCWHWAEVLQKYFEMGYTKESCYAPVNLTAMFKADGDFIVDLATAHRWYRGRGFCCGQEPVDAPEEGFPCKDSIDRLEMGPCPDEHCWTDERGNHKCVKLTEKDGYCAACHGQWREEWYGSWCAMCNEWDTSGCTRAECMDKGVWVEEYQICEPCNQKNSEGCDAEACGALEDHRWKCFEAECICAPCEQGVWGRVSGCQDMTECTGDSIYWNCLDARPESCWCGTCLPGRLAIDDFQNCPADRCTFNGVMEHHCDEEGCRCELCDATNKHGSIGSCSQTKCEPSAAYPDMQWVWYPDGQGVCGRCVNDPHNELVVTTACIGKDQCEAEGFEWKCQEHTTQLATCCGTKYCHESSPENCKEEHSCHESGGNWVNFKGEYMCKVCRPDSDEVEGCAEHECDGTRGHIWKCDEHGCRCGLCDPSKMGTDWSVCPEDRCSTDLNAFWTCIPGEDCVCKKCDMRNMDGGWVGNCPRHICEMEQENIFEAMHESEFSDAAMPEFGLCKGCFYDAEDRWDTSACTHKAHCESKGFSWVCSEIETDAHCCVLCNPHTPWGCQSVEQCNHIGAEWCHASDEPDHAFCAWGCPKRCVARPSSEADHFRTHGWHPQHC